MKYMNWFGLNLHICKINSKLNQFEIQEIDLIILFGYIKNKCTKVFLKNIWSTSTKLI